MNSQSTVSKLSKSIYCKCAEKTLPQLQTARPSFSRWLQPQMISPNKRNEEYNNSEADGLCPNIQNQAKVSMDCNPCLI